MKINNLGEQISHFISQYSYSQETFAKRLDISKRNLNYIIDTNEVKKLDTFVKICKELGESPEHFLRNDLEFRTLGEEEKKYYFGKERTLVEIDFEYNSKATRAKVSHQFSALFYRKEEIPHFQAPTFDRIFKNIFGLEIKNIRIPLLFSKDTRSLSITHDFKENRAFKEANFQFISDESYLLCKEIEDKETISSNKIYVTYNTAHGRDYTYLKYNNGLYSFFEWSYIEKEEEPNIVPKAEMVELYQLPKNDVFQILEVVAVLSIRDSGFMGNFELLHTAEDLRQIATNKTT